MNPSPEAERPTGARLALLTALALVAFAGNSLLCRAALAAPGFDAGAFTLVRLVSGAFALGLFARPWKQRLHPGAGSWGAGIALLVYAAAFSWAYLHLTAGTGALLLFGAVQATMNLAAWVSGERPGPLALAGLALAFAGLGVLVAPGLAAPPLGAAVLMLGAGVAWGIYSLRGRGSRDPLGETATNFIRAAFVSTIWFSVFALIRRPPSAEIQILPLAYAVLSGALTSGVGYAVWYTALRGLTASRAALVQLAVPPLAALGGTLLLGEAPTLRLIGASLLILGGIAIGCWDAGRRRRLALRETTPMKSVSIGLLSVWLLGTAVALAAEASSPDPAAEARAQVEAAVQSYAEAIQNSTDKLADLYAPDGELIQPGMDPLVGPEAIRAFLAPLIKRVRIENATMTSRAIDLYGDEAYVWGDYSQRVAVGERPVATFTGRFVAQWHRTEGTWKLRRMMVQPAPPTAG